MMKKSTNGEILKTYKMPCLKGICDEIVDVEEIGYINNAMHLRCIKCGYVQQIDGVISVKSVVE